MESFETHYEHGDVVEIVTPDEYRNRGGECTERCAIAQFAGSICEIDNSDWVGGHVTLIPLTEKRNFEDGTLDLAITSYSWQYRSIKRVEKECDPALVNAFDDVFE